MACWDNSLTLQLDKHRPILLCMGLDQGENIPTTICDDDYDGDVYDDDDDDDAK
jgi:hypothetical protein